MSLDLGELLGSVDLIITPFERKYGQVVSMMAKLGVEAERSGASTTALDDGLAGVAASSNTAAAGLARANTALRGAGVSASDAAAATRAAATSTDAMSASMARTAGATSGVELAMSKATQAELRLVAAQERLDVLQTSGTASAGRLAAAQAAAAAAADRAAISQERVRTSSRFSSTTVHGLIGEATGLTSALEGIPTPVTVVAGALGKLGIAASVTGAGIALASIDMAQKFQAATARIHTQADASTAQVARLSKGMLAMAGSVATAPTVLANAAYHIASVGQKSLTTAQQLRVLKVSAEGAKLGNADLVDVTNALDAALVANMKGVQNYSQVMGVMNSVVGAGDMSMQDFADAFGPLGSTFKGFGVTIQQAGAALAVFGDNNIRGSLAGSQLRQTITSLADPLKAGQTQLELWGIKSGNLAAQLHHGGLTEALDVLKRKMTENGITASEMGPKLAEMFGKRGPQQGLSTLLNELDRFHGKLDTVTHGGESFASSWTGYTKTFSYNLDAAKAALESLAVSLGTKLLPEATKALHWVGTVGVADLQRLGDWLQAHKADFEAWAHAAQIAIRPWLASLKSAINVLTAVIDIFEGHWGAAWHHMTAAVRDAVASVRLKMQAIGLAVGHMGSSVTAEASKAWHAFLSATQHGVDSAVSYARRIPGRIGSALAGLAGQVGHAAMAAWHAFLAAAQHGGDQAVSLVKHLPGRIVAAIGDLSGLLVHAGEQLVSGLWAGFSHAFGGVLSKMHSLLSHIPGLHGSPSFLEMAPPLLQPTGALLADGLGMGFARRLPAVVSRMHAALAAVYATISGAVAPPVTDPNQLAHILGVDTHRAVSAQVTASRGKNQYEVAAAAARDAAHAVTALQRADNHAEAAAKRHAQALSNEAHAAHEAAANMNGTGKAAAAAKHTAEVHARALDDEARAASQAATALANADAKKEKSAQHAADVAQKAADKAKAAYQKEASAAQAAAQVAAQAAQDLVSNLTDTANQMMSTITDFKNRIAGDITGDDTLTTLWQQLTGTDASGDPLTPSLTGLQSSLDAILTQAQQFSADLTTLTGEGASQDLISQLADMGSTAGDALAQQLLAAGPSAVAALSATMTAISTVAGTEAQSLADAFYGPGVDAMVQFIEGLESKFPELKRALDAVLAMIGAAGFPTASAPAGAVTSGHGSWGLIPKGFASGVQNFGGGLALVGERGPEYVTLPHGASVYPHGTAPRGSDGASLLDMTAVVDRLDRIESAILVGGPAAVGAAVATPIAQSAQKTANTISRNRRAGR